MKIIIGSVLKPLTDVRHYYKIALSLAKIPNTKISILARQTKNVPVCESITFEGIHSDKYSIFQRILTPCIFFIRVCLIRPDIVIVCTHELLIEAVFYKLISGCKLVYDVQENYALNIVSNRTYNSSFRPILSKYIALKEKLCAKFVDRFWLAESCYQHELTFLSDRFDILENKSVIQREIKPVSFKDMQNIQLLFSGTIAEENGIFEALELAKQLNKINSGYSLSIIGCCHQPELSTKLKEIADKQSFVKLQLSSKPIDYQDIIKEISKVDVGIISYHLQQNFINKVPTKLFEYLSIGLPVILQNNPKWSDLALKYGSSIKLNFKDFTASEIDIAIRSNSFYQGERIDLKELLWSSCEEKLIESINNIA